MKSRRGIEAIGIGVVLADDAAEHRGRVGSDRCPALNACLDHVQDLLGDLGRQGVNLGNDVLTFSLSQFDRVDQCRSSLVGSGFPFIGDRAVFSIDSIVLMTTTTSAFGFRRALVRDGGVRGGSFNLSSNLDSFKEVAHRRGGVAHRRGGVTRRREGDGPLGSRRGGHDWMCDCLDHPWHRFDEHDAVPQNALLHDVPVLPADVARIFQTLERLSGLILGESELGLEISGGALEHIAVEVFARQRLAALVECLAGPIPVDDLGQNGDGGQIRLTGAERNVLIPAVGNDVALEMNLTDFGHRGGERGIERFRAGERGYFSIR